MTEQPIPGGTHGASPRSIIRTPRDVRDIAHIGHAELLTPTPEASLAYFTDLLGLTVVAAASDSVYLRGHGDYEAYCLKLTASDHAGLGHMALRTWGPEALARRVQWLKDAGVDGAWVEPDAGKGPAYEFTDPDGHNVRIYYETSKYRGIVGAEDDRPAMKSNHQRYRGRGANVRRLEHVNLMARDVRACRSFWEDGFALRTFEIIRRDDGSEDGAWLSSTVQGHEVIYVRDYLEGRGRLHHLAFWVDSREDVLRTADLMNDANVPIEAGPSRHIPIQGFYLYTREPGGNRIEVCSGGYLGFDPDDEPVVWTAAEYAAKPGWGARLPSTFRSYGTPGTGAAEESVTADWPSPAGLGPSWP
jgi:catechol 2,3 dioxygenase